MTSIQRQREIMYGGSSRPSPKPGVAVPRVTPTAAPPVRNREEAGQRLYTLSMRPQAEQKHFQAANALFAPAILKAQGNRERVQLLEEVRDQAAAVSSGLGLSDEGSKRFLARIALDVNRPKTRGHRLADAERAALEERYGADKPTLTQMAEKLTMGALVGKPELIGALENCDAAAHLDVVEPIFEVAAQKLAAERMPPEPQNQS
jgi:hypothetical protein